MVKGFQYWGSIGVLQLWRKIHEVVQIWNGMPVFEARSRNMKQAVVVLWQSCDSHVTGCGSHVTVMWQAVVVMWQHVSVHVIIIWTTGLDIKPGDNYLLFCPLFRVCEINSVDGSNISVYCVHECEAANRIGMRSRRFIFTGHINGSIQVSAQYTSEYTHSPYFVTLSKEAVLTRVDVLTSSK